MGWLSRVLGGGGVVDGLETCAGSRLGGQRLCGGGGGKLGGWLACLSEEGGGVVRRGIV